MNTDKAAEFSGGSGHALVAQAGTAGVQANGVSFSVEAWVNHDVQTGKTAGWLDDPSRNATVPAYIASQGEESSGEDRSTDEGWRVGFSADMHFVFGFGAGDDLLTRETLEQDRGQWHHWAVTYDKDSKERVIYRDGVALAKDTSSSGEYDSEGKLVLGFRHVHPESGESHYSRAGRHFSGFLDEVRIFSTSLTARNVQEFMSMSSTHVLLEHPQKTSILAYYDFNAGSESWLQDESGNGNHLEGRPDGDTDEALAPEQGGGVGQKAIFTSPGKGSRQASIFKICPARQKVARALSDPANLVTDYSDVQEDLRGKACDTDLGHRHAVMCNSDTQYHTAHLQRPDRGMPREYYCDGDFWMPMPFSFTDIAWSGRTTMDVDSEMSSTSDSGSDSDHRRSVLAEEGLGGIEAEEEGLGVGDTVNGEDEDELH